MDRNFTCDDSTTSIKCVCEKGRVYDDNGNCVFIEDCPANSTSTIMHDFSISTDGDTENTTVNVGGLGNSTENYNESYVMDNQENPEDQVFGQATPDVGSQINLGDANQKENSTYDETIIDTFASDEPVLIDEVTLYNDSFTNSPEDDEIESVSINDSFLSQIENNLFNQAEVLSMDDAVASELQDPQNSPIVQQILSTDNNNLNLLLMQMMLDSLSNNSSNSPQNNDPIIPTVNSIPNINNTINIDASNQTKNFDVNTSQTSVTLHPVQNSTQNQTNSSSDTYKLPPGSNQDKNLNFALYNAYSEKTTETNNASKVLETSRRYETLLQFYPSLVQNSEHGLNLYPNTNSYPSSMTNTNVNYNNGNPSNFNYNNPKVLNNPYSDFNTGLFTNPYMSSNFNPISNFQPAPDSNSNTPNVIPIWNQGIPLGKDILPGFPPRIDNRPIYHNQGPNQNLNMPPSMLPSIEFSQSISPILPNIPNWNIAPFTNSEKYFPQHPQYGYRTDNGNPNSFPYLVPNQINIPPVPTNQFDPQNSPFYRTFYPGDNNNNIMPFPRNALDHPVQNPWQQLFGQPWINSYDAGQNRPNFGEPFSHGNFPRIGSGDFWNFMANVEVYKNHQNCFSQYFSWEPIVPCFLNSPPVAAQWRCG